MDEIAAAAHVAARLGVPAGPAHRLTGGRINEVFRVQVPGGSVVLKHAPGHIASLPAVAMDPVRSEFEARALRFLAQRPPGPVRAPRLLDQVGHTLILEDLGEAPDLSAWLSAGGDPGRLVDLGAWLRGLHEDPDAPLPLNSEIQRLRQALQYQAVGGFLGRAGIPDAAALGQLAEDLGRRFCAGGPVFIMGDLWPPSVRMDADAGLQVLDWEMSSRGHRAQDLGHLLAHLWIGRARLGHPPGARRALLQGYGPVSAAEVQDCARHLGCELLIRALGPFQPGSAFDGLPPTHPAVQEAAQVAALALRSGRLPKGR